MKKIIVMMGGQGVGKGTFSEMLSDKFGYKHIETGAMLRSALADSDIAKTIARGELVSDEMLFDMIASQIGNGDVILDGFPRTIGQAKWLIQNFAGKLDIRVIYLEVPEDIMITRINKRIKDGHGHDKDKDKDHDHGHDHGHGHFVNFENLSISISICQSIQSTFPVTVEFLADYCEPRSELPLASCSPTGRPNNCSVVFP